MNRADLYLKLPLKSPTSTLYQQEPDQDSVDPGRIVAAFKMRDSRDGAMALLPRVHARPRVQRNVAHQAVGDLVEAGAWLGRGDFRRMSGDDVRNSGR